MFVDRTNPQLTIENCFNCLETSPVVDRIDPTNRAAILDPLLCARSLIVVIRREDVTMALFTQAYPAEM